MSQFAHTPVNCCEKWMSDCGSTKRQCAPANGCTDSHESEFKQCVSAQRHGQQLPSYSEQFLLALNLLCCCYETKSVRPKLSLRPMCESGKIPCPSYTAEQPLLSNIKMRFIFFHKPPNVVSRPTSEHVSRGRVEQPSPKKLPVTHSERNHTRYAKAYKLSCHCRRQTSPASVRQVFTKHFLYANLTRDRFLLAMLLATLC